MGGCEEGRVSSFRTQKNDSEEKEPVDARRVKIKNKKEGGINPRSAALSVGRCLARSGCLDGRGGSRNRGGSAVRKHRKEAEKRLVSPCDPLYSASEAATGKFTG